MWEEHSIIDITSAFVGITTPLPEIIAKVQELGWNVENVSFKGDAYKAIGKSEDGEKLETTGNTEATAVGNLLAAIQRLQSMRMTFNSRVAAWDEPFVDLQEAIAHEYAEAKMYDKKAAQAWMELAEDCRRRVEIIQDEIDIEVTDNPIPYLSYSEMVNDITEKGHFKVSKASASHPIWSVNQVVDFRITHDILGHVASGGDWSWFGINRAFQAHAPLLTYTAQKALFTEVLGQGAFNNYYSSMASQKITFLKIFDNPQEENEPYHHPVHPSQTVVPGPMAKIPFEENFKESSFENLSDPNDGYKTNVHPLENNAYTWHKIKNADGEMVDPLYSRELSNVINKIKSNWHEFDDDSQHQAVANAFRNAFMKPGKHERGHAQHYQAINHLPGTVDDPHRYWDALTHARDIHNNARGYLEANKELEQFLMPFKRQIKNLNPQLRDDEVGLISEYHLLNMRAEEEQEAKEKLGKNANADDIHKEATKRLEKRLKRLTNVKVKQDYDFGEQRMFFESKHEDPSLYPSPLAHHIKPITEVSNNIRNITKHAIEDIKKGGKGHHFRSSVMQEHQIDDPHAIDEAWFYLAPETSQLGIIDPKISKLLGYKDDDLNIRDYFKAERELQAARDASGYGHMPLGQFSKALKNAAYHGFGHHPSKDHLHPIKPSAHNEIDWTSRKKKADKPKIPNWFNDTKNIRKQVGKDWDRTEGVNHTKESVPFKKKADDAFSTFMFSPFFIDPQSNQKIYGTPGQSIMSLINDSFNGSTLDAWVRDLETGKEVVNHGT